MRIEQDIERKFPVAVIGDQRVTGRRGGEKLLQGGSNPVGEAKNCFGMAQIPLGKQEFAMGALKINYEDEKLLGDGSNPLVKAKNHIGETQISQGRPQTAPGRLKSHRGDEKLLQGGSNPVGEVKNCFGAGQIERGRADERCGKRQMRTSEMRTKVEGDKLATALLTIKYDNSPAERIVGPTKKAHLSVSKPKGDSDNKCRLTTNKLVARSSKLTAQNVNPYFPVLPGKRTVTNKLIKQSCAYET